jgi:hypothetical protein
MKKFGMIAGVTFMVTLAMVIGLRMSTDAMAVVVGIVCGVLASIPTSTLLVWVMRQRDKQMELQQTHSRAYGNFPPVVVVNGQGTNGYGNGTMIPALPTGTLSGARNFKVIGQENTESGNGDLLPPFWDEL